MMERQSPGIEKPRLFDERDSGPALLKLWFPFLLSLIVIELCQPPLNPGSLVLSGLFATAVLFLLTLALIMPGDRNLRYRRFIRWHTINYEEIIECER